MRKLKRRTLRCETLESRRVLAALPMITEFLSSNDGQLLDGNGDASDWIELFNAGDTSVNLDGFHLTDDSDDLTKWKFPAVELAPNDFLVVFASGSGVVDAEGHLHTSFRLDRDGEYLGLVGPDGATILSQFDPTFPPQESDVSYGIEQVLSSQVVVDGESAAKILIPDASHSELAKRWTGSSEHEPFDDSNWTSADASIGYDDPDAIASVNIADQGTATQSTTDFGRPAANAIDGDLGTFTHTSNRSDSWWRLEFENDQTLGRIVLWNRADCCAERLSNFRVTVSNSSQTELFSQDYFTTDQGGGHPLAGEAIEILLPAGTIGNTVELQVLGQNNAGNGWLSLADVEVYPVAGYDGLFSTDVTPMKGRNASAYMRIPFQLDSLDTIDSFTVRVRYDDGFVAYLNGHEIARRNAPNETSWSSFATQDRSAEEASQFEEIALGTLSEIIRQGDNLLALHGLNDAPDSSDFLMSTELVRTTANAGAPAFFRQPTPGQFNGSGIAGFVADTTFSVDRGLFSAPFETVVASQTPGATLVYTTDGSKPTRDNGILVESTGDDSGPATTIAIDETTTLRVFAFKEGYETTNVDTQSYILIEDVLRQPARPAGLPTTWDGISQAPIRADYEMDPVVVDSDAYRDVIREGLTSLPTMSIVMDPEDLFGAERGIYVNSAQRGREWEHPTSMEIIQPDGSSFQVDTGIRIHGFSWRFHSNTPKHSFRLEFRDEYGPSKLNYPMFPDAPVERFDSIVLRAQGGRAWAGQQNPSQAQYIRDAYARDTARDMGKVDGHAAFFQLYLNGLFWGLYHAVERPDAQMAEEYFGGSDEDYDALNRRTVTNEAIDGDLDRYNEMIALANRGVTTAEAYAEMQRYVDVDNLIDFFLIHQYMTNRDGPETFQSNNQRALGSRVGDPKFRFFVWDMEYSMWNVNENINIDVDVPTSASRVYSALRENSEFRLRYADRVHKHLFNDGALTPENAQMRWQARADEINTAIVAESARWGDAKRNRPYTRDVEWQRELNRLTEDYFPQRTDVLVGQLREAGLYPDVAAPVYSQQGGPVIDDFRLSMAAPEGTVFYTLDGTDPRRPTLASQGQTLIPAGADWKFLDDGSDQGDAWSAPDFVDDDWSVGPAELGYGEGDEATVVNCGVEAPSCKDRNHVTTYFRREFQVQDLSQLGDLDLLLKRDDGAVVYINGQEVLRTNLPDDLITSETLATRTGSGRAFNSSKISSSVLVQGRNVIAVEIHQRSQGSDDISFDLELLSLGTVGGEPAPTAQPYSVPIRLNEDVVVRSRVFHNGNWSAVNDAEFFVGQLASKDNLSISELHYHPAGDGDAEYVELVNRSDRAVSLAGVRFVNAFEFDFSSSDVRTLEPGQRVVVVKDQQAFRESFDVRGISIAGEFSQGRLANDRDEVVLLAADGSLIHRFEYRDSAPWPAAADGLGPSLELIDLRVSHADASNWRASSTTGGTPGRDSTQPSLPGDANRDGVFDSSDLVQVFRAGEYEDSIDNNSSWEDGDWNADGDFNSSDLVLAFQDGNYLPAALGPLAVDAAFSLGGV